MTGDWLPHAKRILEKACTEKFSFDEYARRVLLKTESDHLAEASKEKTWGIGLPLSDPGVTKKDKWIGKNILGETLMKIRNKMS